MKLSPSELEAYSENGFLIRRQVFHEQEVKAFRAAADSAAQTAKIMAASADARRYVLDGNLFADIGHTTVQFEHQENAGEIRVIEPVHELHAQIMK